MLNEENVEKFRRIFKYLQYRDYIKTRRELVILMNKHGANTSGAKVGGIIAGKQIATRTEMVKVLEKVCRNEFQLNPAKIYKEVEVLDVMQTRIDKLKSENAELKESSKRMVEKFEELETPDPEKILEWYQSRFEKSRNELPEADQEKLEQFLNGLVKNLSVIKAYYELYQIKNS